MSNGAVGLERIVQDEIRKKVADKLVASAITDIEATLRAKVEEMLQELEVVTIYKMYDNVSFKDEVRVILKLKESK